MRRTVPTFFSRRSRPLRQAIALVLVPMMALNSQPLLAAIDNATQSTNGAPALSIPAAVTTPTHVKVNRKEPTFTPAPSSFKLSSQPSDQEIFSHPLFAEPLIPIGGKTSAVENAALGQALTTFANRKVRDDFSALEGFLNGNPQSVWRISLLMNMGWLYRQTGWYSKAMDAWQTVWNQGQSIHDPKAKPVVDRALAELIVLNARVGRMDQLKQLIPMADARQLIGSSKEKVEAAKQALMLMKTKPATSFRCGPMALEKIRNLVDKNQLSKLKVMSMDSTQQGTSMLQLKKLSQKLDLNYQVAKRTPGSEVIVPAVVNWKLGHYAALLGKKGDLWHLHDPTFGTDVWISGEALDSEASGYFLVPSGTLPSGWTAVDDKEAMTVWGKGTNDGPNVNNNKGGPKCGCCPNCKAMARFSIYESTTSLSVDDAPLFYQPAFGPEVQFMVSYSQREANQPSTFTYTNLGPLWTCNWLSYVTDDPANPGADVTQYMGGGGTLTFTGYDSGTQSYAPEQQTNEVLKITGSSNYELDMPDGSKEIFGTSNTTTPRQVFLTQTVDPQGNALTYSYDSSYRIVAVTDATGLVTTVTYKSTVSSDPGFYLISTVTDPFGRTASLTYDTSGNLTSSTDMIGIVSHYNYYNGALLSLTTPYGTTEFQVGQDDNKRWVQINDAQGGQQRLETWNNYNYSIPASVSQYPAGEDNSYLNLRNSFFWDREAMMACAGTLDYTKAQITHWCHETDISTMSDVVESVKAPLESRVYYNYLDQPAPNVTGDNAAPTQVSRILANDHTQTTSYQNNVLGLPTQITDPAGRITNYTYAANNVDLTQVSQVNGGSNDVLYSATYNSQHEPLTATDASGQTTTYTYYANGQIETVTDPKGEEATCAYNSGGQLTSITDVTTGATVSFTYDGYDRVQTTTDLNGYTETYDYDNLNRVTKVTYPDGTYDQNTYTNLSLTMQKDRLNRITRFFYNAIEQLTGLIDPQGRSTTYELCTCGALTGLVDALGHRTSWTYDLEGRPISKIYADGSQYIYAYDTNFTSRLLSVEDPKTQIKNFTYNDDDSIQEASYADCTIVYSYDTYYPRLTGATKTIAATNVTYPTSFSYNSAYTGGAPIAGGCRLQTEVGPLGSTASVSYSYDELGRRIGDSINGIGSSVNYDSLGRTTSESNSLGSFTYSYYGTTPRLHTISNNQNGLNTSFTYQTATNSDFRLTSITNHSAGTTILSKFDYTYDEVGNISTWQQQIDSSTPTTWTYGYDKANQLLSATRTDDSTLTVLSQLFYGYDLAGNRTSKQSGLNVVRASFNNLNQTTSVTSGGLLHFTGTLSKPGTVTIGGQAAQMDSAYQTFAGTTAVTTGTNNIPVVATSVNGYAATNTYQVVVPSGTNISPAYDADGNLTNNGRGETYTWDAENELTSITYANGSSTQFTYDAFQRRIAVVEWPGGVGVGTPSSTKRFVWIDAAIAEERENDGTTVAKRFFNQGEQISSSNYYYTFDHLGSIREMVDNSGTIQARYDYDPYGKTSKTSGPLDSDFQFAGYYKHPSSGLNLTLYRAYDSETGKWLSRDPLKEQVSPNLYQYGSNEPTNQIDPTGKQPVVWVLIFMAVALVGYGVHETIDKIETGLQPVGNYEQGNSDLANATTEEARKKATEEIKCSAAAAPGGLNEAAKATETMAKKTAAEAVMPEAENPVAELIKKILIDLGADATSGENSAKNTAPQPRASPDMHLRNPS
jgi:RHS repeat-associated protein